MHSCRVNCVLSSCTDPSEAGGPARAADVAEPSRTRPPGAPGAAGETLAADGMGSEPPWLWLLGAVSLAVYSQSSFVI